MNMNPDRTPNGSPDSQELPASSIEVQAKEIELKTMFAGKDAQGIVQSLVDLYRNVVPGRGAAGWIEYQRALKNITDTLPEQSKEQILILANIGGNGLLRALASGWLGASDEAGSTTTQVNFGKEHDTDEAKKLFASMGVDPSTVK